MMKFYQHLVSKSFYLTCYQHGSLMFWFCVSPLIGTKTDSPTGKQMVLSNAESRDREKWAKNRGKSLKITPKKG